MWMEGIIMCRPLMYWLRCCGGGKSGFCLANRKEKEWEGEHWSCRGLTWISWRTWAYIPHLHPSHPWFSLIKIRAWLLLEPDVVQCTFPQLGPFPFPFPFLFPVPFLRTHFAELGPYHDREHPAFRSFLSSYTKPPIRLNNSVCWTPVSPPSKAGLLRVFSAFLLFPLPSL